MYLALRQADKGATYDKILAELDDDCHVEATTQDAKAPEA